MRSRLDQSTPLGTVAKWFFRIMMAIFAVIPIYAVLIVALTPLSNMLQPQLFPKYWAFGNFVEAFQKNFYGIANSLGYALAAVFFTILISIPAAYVLARYDFKAKKGILFGLLLTQMISGIIVLPSLYKVFTQVGVIGTPSSFILVVVGLNLALVVWLLYGFFCTLPREIEEAAYLDGCSYLDLLLRVVVPISGPGIAVGAIFVFINSYNDFITPLFMLSSKNTYTITLLLYSQLTDTTILYHIVAASALLGILPPAIIFLLFQKSIIKGVVSGAVKG